MHRDDQENIQPHQGNAPQGSLHLDEQGVPILEEVIETATTGPERPETAEYSTLVNTIHDRLAHQFKDSLQRLAEQTAYEVAIQVTRELEPRIKEQLTLLLEQQTAQLIAQIIAEELGKQQD